MIDCQKAIYFKTYKDFIKAWLLREHEYYIYKYVAFLRREERSRGLFKLFWRRKKNVLGVKLGIYIPEYTCGKNLKIWHYGNVIINGYSKIGENVIFHGNNCVGNDGISEHAPKIGNNVDVGFGAIIIGNVIIADNITIGAGAVVNKSFTTAGVTLVGVPAKMI